MQFILASGNQHKASEFSQLFSEGPLDIVGAEKAIEVVEDGTSYEENALKKARAYYEHYGRPAVSDDSGLNVAALQNELGIFSARFGGEGLTDRQRAELLLERLKEVEGEEARSAYFSCTLCFYISEKKVYFFEGRLSGFIAQEYKGDGGFGYDPVFVPEKRKDDLVTLAMVPEWKALHCHRAKACQHATKFFQERVGQI